VTEFHSPPGPLDDGPLDDLEALVRTAQDYVHASDDLRPRVLEAARSQREQQLTLGYLQHAAVVLVVLGALASALYGGATGTADSAKLADTSPNIPDGNWGLVDSFTELRRRQAVLLGSASEFPQPHS
jgi:hypothetical protein